MSTRKAYHEQVFSHEFATFHGYRDSQGPLWPDHRFSPAMSGVTCSSLTLRPREGDRLKNRLSAGMTGVWSDGQKRLVAQGTTVSLQVDLSDA